MTTEIIFFNNHAENEAGRLVPAIESLVWGKNKWSAP